MSIGDMCPQEPIQEQDQPSSTQASPPTQDEGQDNQVDGTHQGGDKEKRVNEDKEAIQPSRPQVPHLRVHQTIPRDHPMDMILEGIHKWVTTRSRIANFYENYSFVFSFEFFGVEDALTDLDWVVAMQENLYNFKRNEVWNLIPRSNQNVIGTKWVYHNNQYEHGVVTRNMAWFMDKGYSQVEAFDFDETFAPIMKLESIRISLAYATYHDFQLYQIDVKSASSMDQSRKCSLLSNFHASKMTSILTMSSSSIRHLCGFKQTTISWYECLRDILIANSFKIGKTDPTLFTKAVDDDLFSCQIYVDDIIFGSTNQLSCQEFSRIMIKDFGMSMMGELSFS
jgi:hypothetical protein